MSRVCAPTLFAEYAGRGINVVLFLAMLSALSLEVAIRTAPVPSLEHGGLYSAAVISADNSLLVMSRTKDDRYRLYTTTDMLSKYHRDLLIAYEDKRFYSHRGVDMLAVARAVWQAISNARPVSGASTITMQLARLADPKPRTVANKVREALQALRIERTLSKDEILSLYLTHTPFGGNIESAGAAAWGYFGKPVDDLDECEAALLVALPQAPERRRPDRNPHEAIAAAERVLMRFARGSRRDCATLRTKRQLEIAARHISERVSRQRKGTVQTFIDRRTQKHITSLIRRALAARDPKMSAAVVVLRNTDGAVVAYQSGTGYREGLRAGDVDLVRAVRSPGSALKPFIYAMALEDNIAGPQTLVADAPIDYDGYQPNNFDRVYLGDITIAKALQASVNTTAVSLLDAVGPRRFAARLSAAGVPLALPVLENEPGLGIALGGAGISLLNLTRLYGALSNNGRVPLMRLAQTDPGGHSGRLMSQRAAAEVSDILANSNPPPQHSTMLTRDGERRIAFKTGTSYGFRDAWAVGFDRLHTVGVWLGRPDGQPELGQYGLSTAAPIMMQVFNQLLKPARGIPEVHPVTTAGVLAPPKRFIARGAARPGDGRLTIVSPRHGAVIAGVGGDQPTLELSASGGRMPYAWEAVGASVLPTPDGAARLHLPGPGQIGVVVVDAEGRRATASFWYDG